MSMTTVSIIIVLFGSLAIGMTLVAAYFAAAYKDEKRKNLKAKAKKKRS
jgi:hypothetical protein